jgi:hypothetical protein
MSDKKTSSLEKIGYTRDIPKGANLDNFETISVKNKSGEQITLYRNKLGKEELDETSDFNRSWDIFNSNLN